MSKLERLVRLEHFLQRSQLSIPQEQVYQHVFDSCARQQYLRQLIEGIGAKF